MTSVDPITLKALNLIAQRLGIRDIGLDVDGREIFLLGTPRQLNATIRGGLKRSWEVARQQDTDSTWDGLEYVLIQILRDNKVPQPGEIGEYGPWEEGRGADGEFLGSWCVIPIPAPGGPQVPWFSAKNGRLMPATDLPYYTLCSEKKKVIGRPDGPAILKLRGSDLPPVFVSHGIDYAHLRRAERCGGLLWPSLAIGWKVPPRYGDLVMIADARVVTSHLPPTGRRNRDLVFTASDSWSPAGNELEILEKAINHELRGDRKWWSGSRSREEGGWGQRSVQSELVFGSRDIDDLIGSFAPDEAKDPLKNMNQFWRRVKHLVGKHTEVVDLYEYEERDALMKRTSSHGDFYHYMELKVRGNVSLESFVACVYPSRLEVSTNRFLNALGFRGWRIPFRWNGKLSAQVESDDSPERAAWAAAATQALLDWSKNPYGPGVKAPEFAIGQNYSATAEYDKSSGYLTWPNGGVA